MKNNLDFVIGAKEARSLKVNSEKINQMVQETLQYVYSEIRRVAHVKTKLLFTYDVCFNAYENIPFLFPESVDKIISNDIKLENDNYYNDEEDEKIIKEMKPAYMTFVRTKSRELHYTV